MKANTIVIPYRYGLTDIPEDRQMHRLAIEHWTKFDWVYDVRVVSSVEDFNKLFPTLAYPRKIRHFQSPPQHSNRFADTYQKVLTGSAGCDWIIHSMDDIFWLNSNPVDSDFQKWIEWKDIKGTRPPHPYWKAQARIEERRTRIKRMLGKFGDVHSPKLYNVHDLVELRKHPYLAGLPYSTRGRQIHWISAYCHLHYPFEDVSQIKVDTKVYSQDVDVNGFWDQSVSNGYISFIDSTAFQLFESRIRTHLEKA